MFSVGDYVVHGNSGVCKVDEIQTIDSGGSERNYYILIPLYTSGSRLFVPVDSKKVVTRAVMTKNDAEKLISDFNNIDELLVENDKKREEVYKEALRSCDCRQWIQLIKTSYHRNQTRLMNGKKATTSDERYLQMAEDNLFGELAIPYNMTKSEVEEYFISKVSLEPLKK